MVDIIRCEPQSSHSLASLVLLTDYYRGLEVDSISTIMNVDVRDGKYDGEFIGASNYSLLSVLRKIFNRKFLEKSKLVCEYCGEKLILAKNKPEAKRKNAATVDHRNPLLENCDWFNSENLAVCCKKCNSEKKDMSLDEWNSLTKTSH